MKPIRVVALFLAIISIFLYILIFRTHHQHYEEMLAVNSLKELERSPQIVSARRLLEQEIQRSHSFLGIQLDVDAGFFDSRVIVYEIMYRTTDGAEVLGFISAPVGYLDNEYPIIIFNRGDTNNTTSGVMTRWRHLLVTRAAFWSTQSYISLMTFYRDGRPFGVEGVKYDQWGGNDVYDVLALLDLSEALNFRGSGLFMIGESRGGMMTYLVLRKDDRVDAAVVVFAVADNVEGYGIWGDTLSNSIGGSPDELPYEYYRRSAVNWAHEITTPLLILHGALDEIVPLSQSHRVYDKMRAADRDVTFIVYEHGSHRFDHDMLNDTIEWLRMVQP